MVLAVFPATILVSQMTRKPIEMFIPVSGALNELPTETWRQYGPHFREYSIATITPELLAALAQVEGADEPVASTHLDLDEVVALCMLPAPRLRRDA